MRETEIILVYDNSTDDTLSIIENLQKEEPRIRIINNNGNKGTLYNRCIGTLIAKGKYILHLDNDDIFLLGDIFEYLYNISEKYNLNVLEFDGIQDYSYNYDPLTVEGTHFNWHKDSIYYEQPILGEIMFRGKENILD